jgi:transcriptional regulator with XRE-family HTH domain
MAKKLTYLRAVLKDAGYRDRDLAEKLNITETSVSKKFTGKSDWWLKEVETMIQLTGVTDSSEKMRLLGFHLK